MSEQNKRVLEQFRQQAGAYAALVNQSPQPVIDPLLELLGVGPDDRSPR